MGLIVTPDQKTILEERNCGYRFCINYGDPAKPRRDELPQSIAGTLVCLILDKSSKPNPRPLKQIYGTGASEQEAFDDALVRLKEMPKPRSLAEVYRDDAAREVQLQEQQRRIAELEARLSDKPNSKPSKAKAKAISPSIDEPSSDVL